VGGFGYPALVAYAPKDAKLSTMRRCVCGERLLLGGVEGLEEVGDCFV